MRISAGGLGHGHLDRVSRLLLRDRGEKHERADDEHEHDDENCNSGHGSAFAEAGGRCIALSTNGFGQAS